MMSERQLSSHQTKESMELTMIDFFHTKSKIYRNLKSGSTMVQGNGHNFLSFGARRPKLLGWDHG